VEARKVAIINDALQQIYSLRAISRLDG